MSIYQPTLYCRRAALYIGICIHPSFCNHQRASKMDKNTSNGAAKWIVSELQHTALKLLFSILSVGPIPVHIAFIMDGNRRFAKKHNMIDQGMGHRLGFLTLISRLKFCYELGIRHVTLYAFSIDNFRRRPEEVKSLMELIREKMESFLEKDSFVFEYGVRVHVAGDLTLLDEPVRRAALRLMEATSKNAKFGLSICVAYTSTDEIARGVAKACEENRENNPVIGLVDVERRLDLSVAPDPDIIIRTSGETRLSNFMMWQSAGCLLYSPSVEWPEIGVRHLIWAILNFQRMYSYFEKKRKQV